MMMSGTEIKRAGVVSGMEAAGTVVAVGKNVKDLKPNERVWTSGTDSFCSMFNAPKILTYALPDGASFAQAATAQVAYVTAHRGLVDMARLKKGTSSCFFNA
jgi:NADPH:quinone reductase-like Zn-dependent oxidoreductase